MRGNKTTVQFSYRIGQICKQHQCLLDLLSIFAGVTDYASVGDPADLAVKFNRLHIFVEICYCRRIVSLWQAMSEGRSLSSHTNTLSTNCVRVSASYKTIMKPWRLESAVCSEEHARDGGGLVQLRCVLFWKEVGATFLAKMPSSLSRGVFMFSICGARKRLSFLYSLDCLTASLSALIINNQRAYQRVPVTIA